MYLTDWLTVIVSSGPVWAWSLIFSPYCALKFRTIFIMLCNPVRVCTKIMVSSDYSVLFSLLWFMAIPSCLLSIISLSSYWTWGGKDDCLASAISTLVLVTCMLNKAQPHSKCQTGLVQLVLHIITSVNVMNSVFNRWNLTWWVGWEF